MKRIYEFGLHRPILLLVLLLALALSASSQHKANLVVNADQGEYQISRHIYGHFSEHLGRCIYGGYWVGEDSEIPNTRVFAMMWWRRFGKQIFLTYVGLAAALPMSTTGWME